MIFPEGFQCACLPLPWGKMAWWERRGDGPTVVLLHGGGCDSTDWLALIGHLPEDHRLLLADFRGHGASDAPEDGFTIADLASDVGVLLDYLGTGKVLVAGHSLGGMVAMALAQERPGLVAALVLYEGWPSLASVPDGWDSRPLQLAGAERERIASRHRRTVARVGARKWLTFWRSVEEFDGRPFLESTPVRIIAVWGDRSLPRPKYSRLGMPPSLAIQHLWIEGAGHYMFIEQPRIASQPIVRLARRLRR